MTGHERECRLPVSFLYTFSPQLHVLNQNQTTLAMNEDFWFQFLIHISSPPVHVFNQNRRTLDMRRFWGPSLIFWVNGSSFSAWYVWIYDNLNVVASENQALLSNCSCGLNGVAIPSYKKDEQMRIVSYTYCRVNYLGFLDCLSLFSF